MTVTKDTPAEGVTAGPYISIDEVAFLSLHLSTFLNCLKLDDNAT